MVPHMAVGWSNTWRSDGLTHGSRMIQQLTVGWFHTWQSDGPTIDGRMVSHMVVGCSNRWRSYEPTCGSLVFLKWQSGDIMIDGQRVEVSWYNAWPSVDQTSVGQLVQ